MVKRLLTKAARNCSTATRFAAFLINLFRVAFGGSLKQQVTDVSKVGKAVANSCVGNPLFSGKKITITERDQA